MGLKLSRQHRQQMLEWACEAGRHECCGLLLGRENKVERVELAANVADNKESHFEIDPAALISAEKSARQGGLEILGYFHSHPNGQATPSATDVRMAAADGRCWLIIAMGEVVAWRPVAVAGTSVTSFELEGPV